MGHFVSSPREREKRDRRDSKEDEREGQGRKRKMNGSEGTEELKHSHSTLTCFKDSRPCPNVSQYQLDPAMTQDTRHLCHTRPLTDKMLFFDQIQRIFFLSFPHKNMLWVYLSKALLISTNKYMFSWRNKKNDFLDIFLISSYNVCVNMTYQIRAQTHSP